MRPVVDGLGEEAVFVQRDGLGLIGESVDDGVVVFGVPEVVELVFLDCAAHCSFGEGHHGVDIEQQRAAGLETGVHDVQQPAALVGCEGAEIAHDHGDKIEGVLLAEHEVVCVDIGDMLAGLGRLFAGVGDGCFGEVQPCDGSARAGEAGGVETRAASEVADGFAGGEAEVVGDP